MHIKVEEFSELCETYPELKSIEAITANHGEKSEISELCEVIGHLYRRLDNLKPVSTSNIKSTKTEK